MITFLRQVRRRWNAQAELYGPARELPGGTTVWLEASLDWLLGEFGREVLMRPVVLPADLIPADYTGTPEQVREVFASICARMDVDAAQIDLRLDLEASESQPERAAGEWRLVDGKRSIRIRPDVPHDPVGLIAVLAHELGHELLLGAGRISVGRADDEPLTDLLTVFFGFGIFTANASHEKHAGRYTRRGYLGERAVSEALAYYCRLRKEPYPDWEHHLDWAPRMRMGTELIRLGERDGKPPDRKLGAARSRRS